MTHAELAAQFVIDEIEHLKDVDTLTWAEFLADEDPNYSLLLQQGQRTGRYDEVDQYLEDFADAIKVQVDQALEVLRVGSES